MNTYEANEDLFKAAWLGPRSGYAEIALDSGADPNARDKYGRTAMMVAIDRARSPLRAEEFVALLLDRGADPNARDTYGRTALMYAAEHGSRKAAALLLDRGADVSAQDVEGRTAFRRVQHVGRHPEVDAKRPETVATAVLLKAAEDARSLDGSLPLAPPERRFDDLGAPDPLPTRPNRPRL